MNSSIVCDSKTGNTTKDKKSVLGGAVKRLGVLGFGLLLACEGLAFDADTMAFYPFLEKAAGEHLSNTAGSVLNAVDNSRFAGTAKACACYGTSEFPLYSDDLPGVYILDGVDATSPFLGPGDYQSVIFPDHAGSADYGDERGLTTNETARTVSLNYVDGGGASRVQGSSTLALLGLDSALGEQADWTIEFFFKHDSAYTQQSLFHATECMKTRLYSCSGYWNRQVLNVGKASGTENVYCDQPTSFNFSTCGWKHCAIVHTSANTSTQLYFDYGVAGSSSSHVTVAPAEGTSNNLLIGDSRDWYPTTNPFYGRIAALRVTKRALAPREFLVARNSLPKGNLTIDGDYEVAAEGEEYNSVSVTASARITGGRLAAENGLQVSAGTAIFENEGLALTGTSPQVLVDSGTTLRLNTPVSGDGSITIESTGVTYLTAANTFTGPLSLRGAGEVHALDSLAFGSPEAKTTYFSHDADGNLKLYFDGVDCPEPFSYSTDGNGTSRMYFSAHTTNVLRGTVSRVEGRMNFMFNAGSYTVFSNEIKNLDYQSSGGHATAVVDFCGKVYASRWNCGGGVYRFFSRVDRFTDTNYGVVMNSASQTFRMFATNVFAASDTAAEAYPGAVLRFSGPSTFDLNGFDQRVASLAGSAAGGITSETPATLHVDSQIVPQRDRSDGKTAFNGQVTGAASLSVEGLVPVDLGGVSQTSGRLIVTNGATVSFSATGGWSSGDVLVSGAGSTLKILNTAAFTENTTLRVEEGGTIDLGVEAMLSIKGLVVDGVEYTTAGQYGPVGSGATTELSCLTGNGRFVIPSRSGVTGVWVGTDAAQSQMSRTDNWQNGRTPSFAEGIDSALFQAAGDVATVDVAAGLNGITLDRPADSSFTFANGGGALALGSAGMTVLNGTTGIRAFTNNAPTVLTASQTWTLPGLGTTFVQNGPLSGGNYAPLTLAGHADVHLTADNSSFLGDLTIVGDSMTSGCVVHVWNDHALGSRNRVTVNHPYIGVGTERVGKLAFYGNLTLDNVFAFAETDGPKFSVAPGARVEFANLVNFGSIARPSLGRGAELVFSGGMTGFCFRVAPPVGGKMVVTNVPCALGSFNGTNGDRTAAGLTTLEIWTSDNTYTHSSWGFEYGGNILVDLHAVQAIRRTTVSNADAGNCMPKIRLFNYGEAFPEYRLNGFDQSCSYLEEVVTGTYPRSCHARFTSTTPAQIAVYQHPDKTLTRVAWEGAAGLTLEGPGTLTLAETPSPTTGRLEVAGGNLDLQVGWTNVSTVAVSAGSLKFGANQLFSKRGTELVLTGGTLDLNGTDQIVHAATVNGKRLGCRVFTSADPDLAGLVTGSGTLRVWGDGPGTLLIFR